MIDKGAENKRIAKNTLMMYIRMFVMMFIGLFTSRVMLQALGITDAGVQNAVGGVIGLFGFVTGSLGNATSRFITFSLGTEDKTLMLKTFGNLKAIYYSIAVLFFLFGQTVGLYFLYHYLVIPPGRMTAALCVLEFAIFSGVFDLFCVPYNSAIIAHEKMSAFAYMSIWDATMKLLICYAVMVTPFDRLITYAALGFVIAFINRTIYAVYSKRHFEEVSAKPAIDKKLFKDIFTFAGWTLTGNIAWICNTQGSNILLNMFFGPVVNAARGVASQVQGVLTQFVTNFQTALNPQITKSYARHDLDYMHELVHQGTRFSYMLQLFLSLPVIFEAPFILNLWLVEVPDHTITFLRIILLDSLVLAIYNPIVISIHATGDLKLFQTVEPLILLTQLPISYVGLKFFHLGPDFVFLVILFVDIVAAVARIIIVLPKIHDTFKAYFHYALWPIIKVTFFSFLIPSILYKMFWGESCWRDFFIMVLFSVSSAVFSIYFLGFYAGERKKYISLAQSFIKSKFRR